MKTLRYLAALSLVMILAGPALAEEKPPTEPPSNPMEKVLPSISFQGVTLEDAIEYLQDASPGFKASVVRDAGVPEDYPQIKLKLKNVTVADVWMLLQMQYPHIIEAQPVRDDGSPSVIFAVQIHNPPAGDPRAAAGGGVKVYRLGAILDALSLRGGKENPNEGKKQSLNQVLSLVKAAVAQVSGKTEPVLQVHEETETLVFKGTPEQRAAVQEVLDALDPNVSPNEPRLNEERRQHALTAEYRDKAVKRADEATAKLLEVSTHLAEEQKISQERAMEVEKLKVRLEENRKIDKAKGDQQAKAAAEAVARQQVELEQLVSRLTGDLDREHKLRDQAEHAALDRAVELEKMKVRLEETLAVEKLKADLRDRESRYPARRDPATPPAKE